MDGIELMTATETADFLKVSKQWIYQAKAKHKIPFKKIGGNVRFEKSEIIAWLDKNSVEPKK